VRDLNECYLREAALHEIDFQQQGFQWVDCRDAENSVISFLRRGSTTRDVILVVANFTPVPRLNYRVGVPLGGYWQELLNSDAPIYGGTAVGNFGGMNATPVGAHGMFHSLLLSVPPLGVVFLKGKG
jgi:1,4-alpha-glucan branching enzyme